MRKYVLPIIIFFSVFLIYFFVGSKYAFKPKWSLDYFNPLAQSILHFRLDIQNPGSTYDLSFYKGKWYGPWGIIPSLILVPFQLIKGHFIPTLYLSVFFASLNTVFMYLILKRVRKDFLPEMSKLALYVFLLFFAFGTTQFYVGTLGSVWHVDQITSSFFGTLGIYTIFRKERKFKHYLISMLFFSLTLLGRPTQVMLGFLPIYLFTYDYLRKKNTNGKKKFFSKELILIFTPLFFSIAVFFLYNYLRFGNIFEYGFNYIHEAPYLAKLREQTGPFSVNNIPRNLWFMLFEVPGISFKDNIAFNFNLNGNSIFFLSPALLASFLASPLIKKGKKIIFQPYIASLWIISIVTLIPSLMHYGSGWMQFGYRYSLDVNVLLVMLSVFGMKGKVNSLYVMATIFSIVMYVIGINALM